MVLGHQPPPSYITFLLILPEPQCHVIFLQVPAHFEFIPKHNETSYSKPWLVVEPSSALIMPGEKCDVSIQVGTVSQGLLYQRSEIIIAYFS